MSPEKEIISDNTKGFIDQIDLTPTHYEMQRLLRKLDDVTTRYECRWGINRLPVLAGKVLEQRWNKHWRKIEEAIAADNLFGLGDLVDGAIRGWEAMEVQALASGHEPWSPEVWEMDLEGQRYRVYQTRAEELGEVARDSDIHVTVEELLRCYASRKTAVLDKAPSKQIKVLPQEFFDKGGDSIPF